MHLDIACSNCNSFNMVFEYAARRGNGSFELSLFCSVCENRFTVNALITSTAAPRLPSDVLYYPDAVLKNEDRTRRGTEGVY
jgi:hypothetical protein